MTLTVEIPMAVPSLANSRGHTRAKGRIVAKQRRTVGLVLSQWMPPDGTVTIRLTRIAPRALDDDNAVTSLKPTRDSVTDWLGYSDDSHANLRWLYGQEKATRARYQAVRVEVFEGHHNCGTCGSSLAQPME